MLLIILDCSWLLLILLGHSSHNRWVEASRIFINLDVWFKSLICDPTLKKQLNGISFFGPWIIELYSSGFFSPKKQHHCNNSTECLLRDEIIKQGDNLDEFLFTPVLLKFFGWNFYVVFWVIFSATFNRKLMMWFAVILKREKWCRFIIHVDNNGYGCVWMTCEGNHLFCCL